MKKENIIQFVGFVTTLDFRDFIPQWEEYARQFMKMPGAKILQRETEAKNSFKYISQHEFREEGFRFSFMKGRNSEHFPEQRVKVTQAGGYIPLQTEAPQHHVKGYVKIMAFVGHNENDIEFYRRLPNFRYLNIYQAYYENCAYGYIMEFFSKEADAPLLIDQLRSRTGSEAALYKDCKVPQI